MFNTLLNWLSIDGISQEVTLFLFLGIVILFTLFLIKMFAKFIKNVKIKRIDKNGVDFEVDDEKECKREEKNNNSITHNREESLTKIPVRITQDYKTVSLILDSFFLSLKEEITKYCQKNGLNEKGETEYRNYIEDKKNIYFNEIKTIFRKEYIAYDKLTPKEIENVIESLKDQTYHKIELLYNRIRDISIKEHEIIEKKKSEEKEYFKSKLNEFIKYKDSNINPFSLNDIISDHYEENEKLLTYERVDILAKQLEKIMFTNDEMKLMYLSAFEEILNSKT